MALPTRGKPLPERDHPSDGNELRPWRRRDQCVRTPARHQPENYRCRCRFDFPAGSGVIDAKLGRGTNNMLYQPAMSIETCHKAMEKGAEFVRQEFENGCNVIGFGEMGIGNTSPASLLLHKFTGIPSMIVWDEVPVMMMQVSVINVKYFNGLPKNTIPLLRRNTGYIRRLRNCNDVRSRT